MITWETLGFKSSLRVEVARQRSWVKTGWSWALKREYYQLTHSTASLRDHRYWEIALKWDLEIDEWSYESRKIEFNICCWDRISQIRMRHILILNLIAFRRNQFFENQLQQIDWTSWWAEQTIEEWVN